MAGFSCLGAEWDTVGVIYSRILSWRCRTGCMRDIGDVSYLG